MHRIEIAYVSNNRFWEYLAIIELPPCHLAFANCIGHSAGHRGRSLTISDDAGIMLDVRHARRLANGSDASRAGHRAQITALGSATSPRLAIETDNPDTRKSHFSDGVISMFIHASNASPISRRWVIREGFGIITVLIDRVPRINAVITL